MLNTIQTHINGLFITFTLIVKLACVDMGIDFYMQCSSETLNLERCIGKLDAFQEERGLIIYGLVRIKGFVTYGHIGLAFRLQISYTNEGIKICDSAEG